MAATTSVTAPHRVALATFLLLTGSLFTVTAEAQGRRARLSADLADHLAAGSAAIDVIVHGTRAEVEALARKYNVRVKRHLRSGAVLRVNAGQLAALQEDGSQEHLSADVPIRSTGDITAETIGADQVWAGSDDLPPLTGAGVTVAVIDSGVDPKHSALRGRIAYTMDFTGGDGVDRYGHGTHVAALIAGRQGRTPETAGFRGIASGARIVNLRVLGDDGSGMSSDVIEAVDWAVENRERFGIRVINLSLGAPVTQPYRDDPMCEAVQRAVAAGMIVVVAAGNYGVTVEGKTVYGSIATPGNDPHVITVGAVDTKDTAIRSDDTVARFSSRGPTRFDMVLKPDLAAPGTRVTSAEAAGSYLARTYPQRHVAGDGANAYIQLSGTSMAAGVVTGTVALLLEDKPRLPLREAKFVLQLTSSLMLSEGLVATGAGSINALGARTYLVRSPSAHTFSKTRIGPETISAGGIAFFGRITPTDFLNAVSGDSFVGSTRGRLPAQNNSRGPLVGLEIPRNADSGIPWDGGDTIFWGTADTIFWGTVNAIFAGNADTIFWGTSDTIFWGTSDTIFWGTSDTIFWGTSDPIFWGATDTIFWGTADTTFGGAGDPIFWRTLGRNMIAEAETGAETMSPTRSN